MKEPEICRPIQKAIRFDTSENEQIRQLAALIYEIQCIGARWKIQQDGCLVWIEFI